MIYFVVIISSEGLSVVMFGYMENLEIVSSFHKTGRPYGKVQDRLTHGFIIKVRGFTDYFFQDKTVRLNAGEMIFLPRGSMYEHRANPNDENLYTSINFQASIDRPEVTVYNLKDFYGVDYISYIFSELWNFGGLSDKYKCLSVFYDLISYISRIENPEKREYSLIEPAVEYLKKHIYDCDFKISKLHGLCGISDTYFRKLFMSRFNMMPQEYVTIRRLFHAKAILESGDYDTIKEVSELSGYNDPLYFSKVFRKVYGFAPSEIKR